MDKEKIENIIDELGFDKNEFWVLGSAALVLRGIIDQANDVDLAITPSLYEKLINNCELTYLGTNHDSKWYKINDFIECCVEEYSEEKVEISEPFNLLDLRYYYENFIKDSTREKDREKKAILEGLLHCKK